MHPSALSSSLSHHNVLVRVAVVCLCALFLFLIKMHTVRGDAVQLSVEIMTILQMSVDSPNINLGTLSPGLAKTATTEVTVSTNSQHGYQLSAHHSSSGFSETLRHEDEVTYFPDKDNFDGTVATTASWSGVGLGFTVYEGTEKNTTLWGTGTSEIDGMNRYSGFPSSQTVIHSITENVTGDVTKIGYKADVSSFQKAGSYSGNVTFSATVTP